MKRKSTNILYSVSKELKFNFNLFQIKKVFLLFVEYETNEIY